MDKNSIVNENMEKRRLSTLQYWTRDTGQSIIQYCHLPNIFKPTADGCKNKADSGHSLTSRDGVKVKAVSRQSN